MWNEEGWIYPEEKGTEKTADCLTEPPEWMDCSNADLEYKT